jgi:hypothetical protein
MMQVRTQIRGLASLVVIGLALGLVWPVAAMSAAGQGPPSIITKGPQLAERLVIQYKDGAFVLVSRTEVTKTLPPSVALPGPVGQVHGCWFEVQDDSGAVLYRRRMSSPQIVYTEYPSEDGSGAIVREQAAASSRTFSILVPRHDKANAVAFYDADPIDHKRARPAVEIGRVTLR